MKIAIMQPTFNPWLGYIYMIESVDAFVFLDNVQFERRSWQSRNKIKLNNEVFMLSLHLQKNKLQASIKDIYMCKDERWKVKFLKIIKNAYSKSVNFKRYYEFLEKNLYKQEKLCDFNISLIEKICNDLDIKTPIFKASSMDIKLEKKEKLLLEICKALKANEYLSPEGAKNYLEKDEAKQTFKNANISIEYFDFFHPTYFQQGKNFIPYLGTLDFLFNEENPALKFKEVIRENQ